MAAVSVVVLGRVLEAATAAAAARGLACAWLASSLGTIWLAAARGRGGRAFWLAFGGGIALRAAFLLALAGLTWRDAARAASWIAYALGVLAFLQLEYRRFLRD